MIKKRPTINKSTLFLIIILLLAFFFRFYRLSDFLMFGMDQEYEAFLVKNILTGKHFPLIGVNASDTGLYLGPAFIYIASIPFAVFSGNPLGWAVTALFFGVITTFAVYLAGKRIFNAGAGFFASFFYGVSWLFSFYDRQFWNPVLVPLLSLILGTLIYKILQGKIRQLLLFSLVMGLGIQSHLSLLIFVPIIFYALWIKRALLNKKIILYSLLIFMVTQSPVIAFDLRHDFTNLRAAAKLISFGSSNTNVNNSSILGRNMLFVSTIGRFFLPPINSDWLVESGQCAELIGFRKERVLSGSLLLAILAIILFIKKNRIKKSIYQNKGHFLLLLIFTATAVFIQIYPRQIFEYYFLFFFPWLAIGIGLSVNYYWEVGNYRRHIVVLITVIALLNFTALLTSRYSFSYREKVKALEFIRENLKGKPYSLEAIGGCQRFGGYRYLAEYFVGRPLSSYMDSYFDWIYKNSDKSKSNITVLLSLIDTRNSQTLLENLMEDKLKILGTSSTIAKYKSGRIDVYILKKGILEKNEK